MAAGRKSKKCPSPGAFFLSNILRSERIYIDGQRLASLCIGDLDQALLANPRRHILGRVLAI
jgi:hypothetical protein